MKYETGEKEYRMVQEQDKLHEMIGRYTCKHGPPLSMIEHKGLFTLNFYSRIKSGCDVTINFRLADSAVAVDKPIPIVPPKPENEKILALVEANVLTKGF
jgi:hypothetical protein